MERIWIEECGSTNTYVSGLEKTEDFAVATRRQTAGRGQRGNVWESEPGKNLTFSAVWHPADFKATRQFAISEAVALAVCDLLEEEGIEAKVKWPNDIYVGDRKICGILIEHSVVGARIGRTVAGVGINVNQREFLSDAPNPVSMANEAGREFDVDSIFRRYLELLESRLTNLSDDAQFERSQHEEFKRRMWRADGRAYPFRDRLGGKSYRGVIRDVEPCGYLHVEDEDGKEKFKYAFKEVEFLL